jgi:hypothetical protein
MHTSLFETVLSKPPELELEQSWFRSVLGIIGQDSKRSVKLVLTNFPKSVKNLSNRLVQIKLVKIGWFDLFYTGAAPSLKQ